MPQYAPGKPTRTYRAQGPDGQIHETKSSQPVFLVMCRNRQSREWGVLRWFTSTVEAMEDASGVIRNRSVYFDAVFLAPGKEVVD